MTAAHPAPLVLALAALLALPAGARAQERLAPAEVAKEGPQGKAPPAAPFETAEVLPATELDRLVEAAWKDKGLTGAHACSDEVFVRRAHLDVIGTLPARKEVLRFLADESPGKRAALVEELMAREEFADYWSMKWCDLLRVKSEFPINLWPNAVQAYARWIHESLRTNKPCDRFARELLTSSGSNFRVPPVNFYRAVQGQGPAVLARAAALTFMGVRLENWPEEKRRRLETFFSRVAFKGTAEWKEQVVFQDPSPRGPIEAVFPDGGTVTIPPGTDPRKVFADWLLRPGNPWFARNIANRVWSWFFGRGIIHEPDDIRPGNPPSNPALLAFLEKELVRSGYDLRHLFRLVLRSRTYQQSPIPRSRAPEAEALFAFYPVRRLDAEVLSDALRTVCGFRERFYSMIPEPFTFVPEEHRCITLFDGSITGSFLELFGRPSRDTGLESERNNRPTDRQRLFLVNASGIQKGLQQSPWLRWLALIFQDHPRELVEVLYLTLLSRKPTAAEEKALADAFQRSKVGGFDAVMDLTWALMNSKEFLYRH